MPIAEHKKLYDGPTRSAGQQMRADVMHIKGHGHGAKIALGKSMHRGMGKGHTKARIKKEFERKFL
jgi:hypothetical protein